MKRYLLQRILMFLLVLTGVSILSFALIGLFGHDPAELIARRTNIHATYEQIEAVRKSMGLDKPMPVRYLAWLGGLLRGDVGTSIYTFKPIMEDIGRYLPVSLSLMGLSLLWVILISFPVSLLCAGRPGGAADHIVRAGSIVGLSFPTFWLGFLLLIAFAVNRRIFTVVPAPGIKGYILPSFALSVPVTAGFIRVFRSSLLKEMGSDYALYARARGLTRGQILRAHAFRNALPPVVTMFCQYLGYLIAGGAVVENVFTLNGLGTYLIGCVSAADSTAVATCAVITAAIFVTANLLGDLLNRLLCPWMVREYNG
ncbi:MAG: ABC transporter permease [Oscillospiraceae bacterium]|nr:ABC transporter permease [Oscillospiraceae bacterium]